jgi:hypothetical protein
LSNKNSGGSNANTIIPTCFKIDAILSFRCASVHGRVHLNAEQNMCMKNCSEAYPKNIKGTTGIGLVDIIDDSERERAIGAELGYA